MDAHCALMERHLVQRLLHLLTSTKNTSTEMLMEAVGMDCYQCTVCKISSGAAAKLATHITRRSSKCSEAVMPEVAVVTNMVHDTCLTEDEYDACSKLMLKPLTSLHPAWVVPMINIMHELLGDMIAPGDVNRNVRGAQALMLLAGVVEYTRDTKEVAAPSGDDLSSPPVMRVIDFPRKLTGNPGQAASRILYVATSAKPPPPLLCRMIRDANTMDGDTSSSESNNGRSSLC